MCEDVLETARESLSVSRAQLLPVPLLKVGRATSPGYIPFPRYIDLSPLDDTSSNANLQKDYVTSVLLTPAGERESTTSRQEHERPPPSPPTTVSPRYPFFSVPPAKATGFFHPSRGSSQSGIPPRCFTPLRISFLPLGLQCLSPIRPHRISMTLKIPALLRISALARLRLMRCFYLIVKKIVTCRIAFSE